MAFDFSGEFTRVFREYGAVEYAELTERILAPCIPNRQDVVEGYTTACRIEPPSPIVIPIVNEDKRLLGACNRYIDEVLNNIVSDSNFSIICEEYDMSRLTVVDSFDQTDFVDELTEAVKDAPVINYPSAWMTPALEKRGVSFEAFGDPEYFKAHGYDISLVPGVETKNMNNEFVSAVMPHPYGLINRGVSMTSFNLFLDSVEIEFFARGKLKRRTLKRGSGLSYRSSRNVNDVLVVTDVKYVYPEVGVLAHKIGDYYTSFEVLSEKLVVPNLNRKDFSFARVSSLLRRKNDHSLQRFQDIRPLAIQYCSPVRVSSLYCQYIKVNFDPGIFFAVDVILPSLVKYENGNLSADGVFIEFGNDYLYSVISFEDGFLLSVILLDTPHVLSKIKPFHSQGIYDKVTSDFVDMDPWEKVDSHQML